MGPSPTGDGELRLRPLVRSHSARLQWGRRQQATESFRQGREVVPPDTASMGPSPTGDGELTAAVVAAVDRHASMGPSPTGDGEAKDKTTKRPDKDLLQWGRRQQATESSRSTVPRPRPVCINGAVANRRRRAAITRAARELPAELQWGRRQQATERWPSAGCASCAGGGGFNGAVANRRRRAVVDEAATPDGPELQWGRRQQATESSDRHGGGQRSVVASMGPSPTGDGEGAGKIGNDLAEFCGHFRTGWVLRRDGGMSAMWAVWRVSVSSRVFVGFLLLVGLRAGPVRGRATGPLAATTSRVAIRISQSMRCQITTAWRSG